MSGGAWRETSEVVLSVLVPAYNEGPTVFRVFERLAAVPLRLEVIAVDDGSSDDTGRQLDALAVQGRRCRRSPGAR